MARGLIQVTNDKFADLQPDWSPDGETIAFVTDRGPNTDFNTLRVRQLIASPCTTLNTGIIEVLPQMEQGKNISPQWAPDGRSIALVSDRTGISNLYLYDFDDRALYQITNFYTGSPVGHRLSPVLSWAREADRSGLRLLRGQRHDCLLIATRASSRSASLHGTLGCRQRPG